MAEYEYQTDTSILVPYNQANTALFPEDMLVQLYHLTLKDDLFRTVFHSMNEVTLNSFVSYLSTRALLVYTLKPNVPMGFAWISESAGIDGARMASFGFTFFRKYHGTKEVRDQVWLCLKWWFTELKIEVLYGYTLRSNRMAYNFSRNFGFQKVGDAPGLLYRSGKLYDATIVVLEKKKFLPLFEAWRLSSHGQQGTERQHDRRGAAERGIANTNRPTAEHSCPADF